MPEIIFISCNWARVRKAEGRVSREVEEAVEARVKAASDQLFTLADDLSVLS